MAQFSFGDVWTWVAIDADTKLLPTFALGRRDAHAAKIFIDDLAARLAHRIQLTTDGLRVYLEAVEGAFGCDGDCAQLVKLYGASQEETRYSPAECIGCETSVVTSVTPAMEAGISGHSRTIEEMLETVGL